MPAKPRVLIFHPAPAPYRSELFNELGRLWHLRIVFLADKLPGQSLDRQVLQGALTVEHDVLRRGLVVRGYALRFGYAAEVKRFQPDIVITSEFGTATLAIALLAGVASRPFDHVIWSDDNPEWVKHDPPMKTLLRQLLLPCAAGLLAVSEEAAGYYQERFRFRGPIGSVPILQGEMRFRRALESSVDEAITLAETHRLLNSRVLLYVGRLAPEKGLSGLLDAFSCVTAASKRDRLVLVGEGPCRSMLERQADALDIRTRVVFAGQSQRKALLAWYRIGGAFVLPSLQEPFGAVVNEALLAGLFVACSRYAGARILVSTPQTGVIFDPMQPTQLCDALSECLNRIDPLTLDGIRRLRGNNMAIGFDQSVRGFQDLIAELGGLRPGMS